MSYSRQQLIEDSSDTLNIEMIKKGIQYTNNNIKPRKDQKINDHLIFNGFSGVGKSTSILTLAGQQIYGYHNQAKSPVINVKNKKGRGGVYIESEVRAGTFHPGFLNIDSKYTIGKNVQLIDMPGQDDNRGINFLFMNCYFYVRLLQIYQHVKLVYVLKHPDIDPGDKANSLFHKLKIFTSMYGNVDLYSDSLVLVISKCMANYNVDDAIKYFQGIRDLPLIKTDKNAHKLINKLADKKIPILVIPVPQLPTKFVLTQENAIHVTDQYQETIINFVQIVKKLKPTKQLKLLSPPLSQDHKKKCVFFATKTKKQIQDTVASICNSLKQYFVGFLPKVYLTSNNVTQIASSMKEKSIFIREIIKLLSDMKQQKESLNKVFNQIDNLFILYNIRPLLERSAINDNKNYCPKMVQLKDSLIMISFLNNLSLNSPPGQLWTELDVYKYFFFKLIDVRLSILWSNVQRQYQEITQNSIINIFRNHLETWQNANIYKVWKKNYTSFPSLIQKINQHMSFKRNTSQSIQLYFNELLKIQEQANINKDDIQQINFIIRQNKKYLQLNLEQKIISEKIKPIFENKTVFLHNKVINYTVWGKAEVQESLRLYSQKERVRDNISNAQSQQKNKLYMIRQQQQQQQSYNNYRWRQSAQMQEQNVSSLQIQNNMSNLQRYKKFYEKYKQALFCFRCFISLEQ